MSDWKINETRDTESVLWRRLDDGREESMIVKTAALRQYGVAGELPAPVVRAPEAITGDYTQAVQTHLDRVAQSWGYDNILTAVTYAGENAVKAFDDEGKALRAWRSRVWSAARQTLADVKDGKTSAPTVADFLASLPPAPARP